MAETLIADATGALTSRAIGLRRNESATVVVSGTLGAAETIDVQLSDDGGTTFADYYSEASQITLTTTNTAMTLEGPCVFRLNKGVTVGAAGASLSSMDNP